MTSPPLPPDRRALFIGFFKVGITAFGGVLPLMRRLLVDQTHWLTEREFTELLGLGQVLPGPNVLNIAIAVGTRYQGASGALACLTGLMLAPLVIILLLAGLYDHFAYSSRLHEVLGGVASVAAGLMLAMGIQLARHLQPSYWRYAIVALTFGGVALWRLPLLLVLLAVAPLSIWLAWRLRAKECAQ